MKSERVTTKERRRNGKQRVNLIFEAVTSMGGLSSYVKVYLMLRMDSLFAAPSLAADMSVVFIAA